MFSDLPTPAHNQTSFQSIGVINTDESGIYQVHPNYYQVAPQGEGGFGSLNDTLRAPMVYNTAASGVPSSRDTKARRRESAVVGVPIANGMHRKTSRSQLRDEGPGG
jgi:RalA-binding protein 1